MRIKSLLSKLSGRNLDIKGITLIELVMAMGLTIVVFMMASNFIVFSQRSLSKATSDSEVQFEAFLAMEHMQRNIRHGFAASTPGSQTLLVKKFSASYSEYPEPSLFYYDSNFTEIRYTLTDNELRYFPDAGEADYKIIAYGVNDLSFVVSSNGLSVDVSITTESSDGKHSFSVESTYTIRSGRITG